VELFTDYPTLRKPLQTKLFSRQFISCKPSKIFSGEFITHHDALMAKQDTIIITSKNKYCVGINFGIIIL
jgi:hypothetical protein